MPTQRQLFLDHLGQTSDFPLLIEIERADGVYLYGPNGERYLDLISGIGVSSLGHRHPAVIEAIHAQVDKHLHVMVYGEFVQSPQVQLGAALADSLPDPLEAAFLVNSGGEAIEGALKMAKRYTGRTELISCVEAYHGSTHGALSVGGNESLKQAYRPLLPDTRRMVYGSFRDLELITQRTAAVLVETIQGEAGVRISCSTWFQALRERCTQVGALLILDEIQCGMGRTGTLWAFEQMGIVPDAVVSAKALGGGMPIGAFVASREVMGVFKTNPILGNISTFGGHPVSAAAAYAALQALRNSDLLTQVPAKAARFRDQLKHPLIRGIRNAGLMMAVEFDHFEVVKPIIDRAIELGVITDWFLFCDNSLRIAPPLIITNEQIDHACQVILQACEEH
ncbi:MAG TPA: aspartate aminotransferase family protein [Cytophagales bacterium]|nr:aspartate aminotransferase family protein [Cytophagales bacterium]